MKESLNAIGRHVGARVRTFRMMLDRSREVLGDSLDLTPQELRKFETGSGRIGAACLQRIAKVLRVPVTFFFSGSPAEHEGHLAVRLPPHASESFARKGALALCKAFVDIVDGRERRSIIALAEEAVAHG